MSIKQRIAIIKADAPKLPPDVISAFTRLGELQRDKPEMAMLRVQKFMGGGVLNPVVEHVGDIIHRMTHLVEYNTVLGREKIVKTLRWLSHPYGFEKEYRENIRNNARENNISVKELQAKVSEALQRYASAFEPLIVYNKAQWLAKQAAVYIGHEEFNRARTCLSLLLDMAPNEETFAINAMKFTKNGAGELMPYKPGSDMP
jgi:hypothetical protein